MYQFIIFCKFLSLQFKLYPARGRNWICQKLQSAIKALFHLLLPHLFTIIVLNGCASYRIPTKAFSSNSDHFESICPKEDIDSPQQIASNHWLYDFIPRHRSQIKWYDLGHTLTWMFFGNDDDGIFGEGLHAHYYPEKPASLAKAVAWGSRNPLHNFCFYVIGSAERENSEIDFLSITPWEIRGFDYKPQGNTVFLDECSSLYLGLHGGKPFLSFRWVYSFKYRFDFYVGWRCRGNFGIKFIPFKKYCSAKQSFNSL